MGADAAIQRVRVLNETGDFYRFFDATPHAEFLVPELLTDLLFHFLQQKNGRLSKRAREKEANEANQSRNDFWASASLV